MKSHSSHDILMTAFKRLQKKNPSFSMRALSRDLDLSPSYVSRIMKGEKAFPSEQVEHFAKVLKLDEIALLELKKTVVTNLVGDIQNLKSSPSVNYDEMPEKDFSILDPWYNITILDLISCGNIKDDAAHIAERIGLSAFEVTQSLNKLKELNYIEAQEGVLVKTQVLVRFPTKSSHPSIRKYHKTMLQKASETMNATDQDSFEKRLIAGISVASNPANIAKARARLNEALFEVCEILREGECSEVFQISGQIFSLTKAPK